MLDFEPQRIVLIKPSALGDIVHSLPVLAALRRRFPDAHVSWVVNRVYEPLLREHPFLDQVIPFDRSLNKVGALGAAWRFGRLLRRLRRQRFDLAIDLQGLFRTGMMTWTTRARVRVGLASAREGSRWFYTHRIDDAHREEHAVDRYWRVAEALGAGHQPKRFVLPVAAEAVSWAQGLLRDLPRPWLAVGVGSRWLTKRWPPGQFAALAQRGLDEFGGTVIFVGASDEAPLAREAASLVRGPFVDVTGTTTLPQLAAVIGLSDVMLANDTGPLHLAVALGRPVVAPYTCTKTVRTGPYGQPGRGVETTVWCRGSYLRRCDRLDCMAELTPERLWPVLRDILVTWQSHRQSA
jgi:lipopolysaccharide heptosyltransferase I